MKNELKHINVIFLPSLEDYVATPKTGVDLLEEIAKHNNVAVIDLAYFDFLVDLDISPMIESIGLKSKYILINSPEKGLSGETVVAFNTHTKVLEEVSIMSTEFLPIIADTSSAVTSIPDCKCNTKEYRGIEPVMFSDTLAVMRIVCTQCKVAYLVKYKVIDTAKDSTERDCTSSTVNNNDEV